VTEEGLVERFQAFRRIRVACGFHFGKNEGMTTDRTLTEHDQVTRHDVGALNRDGNRHGSIGLTGVVTRTQHHRATTVNVHGTQHDVAHHFGHVELHHRSHNGRRADFHGRCGENPRRLKLVGKTTDATGGFLHALELADGQLELATDAGVCTSMRQPLPAMAAPPMMFSSGM